MKQRNSKQTYSRKSWQPKFPTKGHMTFEIEGYVQSVNQSESCDYVDFKLDNPYVEDNINSISVEVSWNLPELQEGDHVRISGNIRSWWKKELEIVTYAFVAEEIEEIKEKPSVRSQRPKLTSQAGTLDEEAVEETETPF